jgi:tRNA nucleotidyltransferase (CCA-adding enzyme)
MRERVRAVPGVEELLPILEGLPPAYLVGGVPRDLLRGERSLDLDVAIEGDGVSAAQEIAARLGGRMIRHERFGTATVESERLVVDVASTRTERYDRPGALPRVAWASLEEDLARRDFSVNAMAIGLRGDELGRLHDPLGGVGDLREGVIRVLHERSFLDDTTRLLRAVRYGARLDFALEFETERLALDAIGEDALLTVSGVRQREELLLILAEVEPGSALERLRALGLDRALHPELRADAELVTSAELGALETGADRVLAGLAALISADSLSLAVWLDRLQMPRPARDLVVQAARDAPGIATSLRLRDERKPSQLARLLAGAPPEALALALAMGAPPAPVFEWTRTLSRVRLEITGDDLREAGVPESPVIGRALEVTLARKLDGEVEGRDEELRCALEAAGVTP